MKRLFAAAVGICLLGGAAVQAASVVDIKPSGVQLSSSAAGLFQATAGPSGFSIFVNGVPSGMFAGNFNLTANLSPSGDVLAGSTLTINKLMPSSVPNYLTGTLTGLEYSGNASSAVFKFTFDTVLDNGTPLFGSKGYVLLTANSSGFGGATDSTPFDTLFQSSSVFADVVSVPSPVAASGGLALMSGLAVARKRRR